MHSIWCRAASLRFRSASNGVAHVARCENVRRHPSKSRVGWKALDELFRLIEPLLEPMTRNIWEQKSAFSACSTHGDRTCSIILIFIA